MDNTNSHTYIQYVNSNGHIKTKSVDRQVETSEIIFTVTGVQEDFFILSLFDKNKKLDGLTFGSVKNLDALGFLNSDFQTLEVLPAAGWFSANQQVAIVKDTNNYDVVPSVVSQLNETQELIFLKSYLKTKFNDGTYEIFPIINTLEVGSEIFPDNFSLYYARFTRSSGVVTANAIDLKTYLIDANSGQFHFFTNVSAVGFDSQMIGYKVYFNYPIYTTGGGE